MATITEAKGGKGGEETKKSKHWKFSICGNGLLACSVVLYSLVFEGEGASPPRNNAHTPCTSTMLRFDENRARSKFIFLGAEFHRCWLEACDKRAGASLISITTYTVWARSACPILQRPRMMLAGSGDVLIKTLSNMHHLLLEHDSCGMLHTQYF